VLLWIVGEFDRCVSLFESPPMQVLGSPQPVHGIRRLAMRRTKHHVYYLHDEPNAVVYITAVWDAPKAGVPLLIDLRR
jgi:hypothetical protein